MKACSPLGKSCQVPDVPPPLSAGVRAVMRGNRGTDTQPERLLRSALHRLGLRFRKHQRPIPTLRCSADAVFRVELVAVFVDGCFWHCCPLHGHQPHAHSDYWSTKLERNRVRDRRNDSLLHKAGWLSIRVWEHEPPDLAAARIAEIVRRRRSELKA